MNTYLRILSAARPFGFYIPQYIFYVLLYVIFSMVNVVMLIPLLNVLFDQISVAEMAKYAEMPEFSLSPDYFKHAFYHYFTETLSTKGKWETLKFVSAFFLISAFLGNLFKYLSSVIMAYVRANAIRNLRQQVFKKITELHLGYFSNERKGDLMSRTTNDIQQIELTVIDSLRVVIREPAMIIGFVIALFMISVELALSSIILLPITGYLLGFIVKKLKKKAIKSQQSLGRITEQLDEALGGIRLIKAFSAQKQLMAKFMAEVRNYARINVSMSKKQQLAPPMSEFLGMLVISGILLFGGSLVLSGEGLLDAASFMTFLIIFGRILQPAKAVSKAFGDIQRGLASGDRVFEIVDAQTEIRNKPNAIEIPEISDSVVYENVSFAYDSEQVLNGINLTIQRGKTVALIGPSGGGKSTIADLLPRFYDPVLGDVKIDGISLKDSTIESVRGQMGIVTQESILFNDSIFNNIAFGNSEASLPDVEAAAKIANAHDFISEMPEGYETNIGDRGTKLSGGQRQRLSIARAILKNPPILILDEATSALDSESERLVQDALTKLMQNRTSLVIAHRLSTIKNADMIVVIKDGQIVEQGTHNELLAKKGVYHKLTGIQNVA